MLRNVDWYLFTDVSEEAVGSHFQRSTDQEKSALKMGPTSYFEMSVNNTNLRWVTFQKREDATPRR
jgi:hypothetical protein